MKGVFITVLIAYLSVFGHSGPGYPACATGCTVACAASFIGYAACMALCLSGCVATCFTPDQPINRITEAGIQTIPMKELNKGDFIQDKQGTLTQVLQTQQTLGKVIFIKITLQNIQTGKTHSIEVTPMHPLYKKGHLVYVKDLKIGEVLQALQGYQKIIALQENEKQSRMYVLTESGSLVIQGHSFGAFYYEEGVSIEEEQAKWEERKKIYSS